VQFYVFDEIYVCVKERREEKGERREKREERREKRREKIKRETREGDKRVGR
jgi:hypothetical protein